MHTHEYAVTALAELAEELARLSRQGACPDRLEATYAHTAGAVRRLVDAVHRPWLERALADVRLAYGLQAYAPRRADLEPASVVAGSAADMDIDSRTPAYPVLPFATAMVAAAAPIDNAA